MPAKTELIWDAVFIGSGMGSLAGAAALARLGRSVLVLEAHTEVGGFTHTFVRDHVRWTVGLHYTGWPLAYPVEFPELWDILTEGQAPWLRLPDETDFYMSPEGVFVKRAPRERHREDLHAAFPSERRQIDQYLSDVRRICADFLRFFPLQAMPRWLERLGPGWWLGRRFLQADLLPLRTYMDRLGLSQRLRNCLCFNWANWDGVPARMSVGAHAIPTEYFLDGLWTPAQGSAEVPAAFTRLISRHGGEVRTRARVSDLVFKDGRVTGVRVNEETVSARVVISDIGARETYQKLIPLERRPSHTTRILALRPSCTGLFVCAGLDEQFLERHSLKGVNYWVEATPGAINREAWEDLTQPPPWFVLTLVSRFQKGKHLQGIIPVEMFVPIPVEKFAAWEGTDVGRRGDDYVELKHQMTERVLEAAEQTWPGFRAAIRSLTSGTPLTVTSFTGHPGGAIYGVAPDVGRYSNRALRIHTGISGLLLTGVDVAFPGVLPAFLAGLATASAVLGRNAAHLVKR